MLGSFPAYGRWAEWNGNFRDHVRRFLRGDRGMVGGMGQRIQGSPDLYGGNGRGPNASINFVTCHDGFTLYDLFSYNGKHNETNGENNADGSDDNFSWNCGSEGDCDSLGVNRLRHRLVKNAAVLLMISQGVPMMLMGDEIGRTQKGNNNTYCHDNDLNWMDWSLVEKNSDLLRFFRNMIAFRRAHPVLRSSTHFQNRDYAGTGLADITWHGMQKWNADWSKDSRALAFMLDGRHAKGGTVKDNTIYVAFNSYWDGLSFSLPEPLRGEKWHLFVNTGVEYPCDVCMPGMEIPLQNQNDFLVGPRSAVILLAR
jgi:isoamylase